MYPFYMSLRFSAFVLLLLSWPAWSATKDTPVIVYKMHNKAFVETIEALGDLRSAEAVTLSATVTDTVSAIHFESGQRVEANDVLVEMTNNEEHALLTEALSTLKEAESQYNRVRSLVKKGLTTEAVVDERKRVFESARAQWAATQSRLEDRLILAPFSGVLGLREISKGTLVRPGDAITTLDADAVMYLDFSVPAVFLSTLKAGLTVVAHSDELTDRTFTGKVASVDSRINPNTRSIIVRAEIPNPNFILKSGMLMTVTLEKAATQSLLLPEEALIQEGFNRFVYKVASDKKNVERIQVETGPRKRGEIVVTQGLAQGDLVVTHGIMHLRKGSTVNIIGEQTEQTSIADIIGKKSAEAQ